MIDHIGTKQVSVRRTNDGVGVSLLNHRDRAMEFTQDEWLDLVMLITAIGAAADFQDRLTS